MLTIGNWLFIGFMLLIAIAVSCGIGFSTESLKSGIIAALISIILIGAIIGGIIWYNTSTAAGVRAVKDYKSNINNGIEREIVITAEDGREIFRYEGKIDIETDHEDNYILFESEEGKRYMIFYGIQDTVLIVER